MPQPGDVVTVEFPGAVETKRRPAVIISSTLYNDTRADIILGLLTTQLSGATLPGDYLLRDWAQAGLRKPTAFRPYLATLRGSAVVVIGHLSEPDWHAIRASLHAALAIG